jgi:hypothetical protein
VSKEASNEGDLPAEVVELNTKHAVVREGGRTLVLTETLDPVIGRVVLSRSSFGDLRNFYRNRKVNAGTSEKPDWKPLGDFWLNHPQRRQFEGVTFQPGIETPGYFNLWRGFPYPPIQGDWSLMQAHLRTTICRNNDAHYRWLLGWMAAALQHPGRQGEICVVLRGKQGTGKGVFARSFGSLFGQHFIHVSNLRHLVGNFNAHLHDAIVLFADEVSWIGDRQGEGVLKMLITEPYIPIEYKGRDVVMAKNHVHLLVASNGEWVVPADLDDRRFFVLDVSDERARDEPYFRAITRQMEHGGRSAMLYDLLHLDLLGIDLRRAPTTEALQAQKRLSMTPQQRWWMDILMAGRILPSHVAWETEVVREPLHTNYAESLRILGEKRGITTTELGIALEKLLPPGYPLKSQRRVGDGLYEAERPRKWHWGFPPLHDCRRHFDQLLGMPMNWPTSEDDDPRVTASAAGEQPPTTEVSEVVTELGSIDHASSQPAQLSQPQSEVGEARPKEGNGQPRANDVAEAVQLVQAVITPQKRARGGPSLVDEPDFLRLFIDGEL